MEYAFTDHMNIDINVILTSFRLGLRELLQEELSLLPFLRQSFRLFPCSPPPRNDGLMLCTESLGFESSEERKVDNDKGDYDPKPCMLLRVKRREQRQRMREWKFPPPLTSWNNKGRPSFFLKPMRRDGKLELTEVRIERPEILCSSRGDGRLRLEFVKDTEFEANNEEMWSKDVTDEDEEEEEEEEEGEEEEPKVLIPREGLERCHESVVAVASHRAATTWAVGMTTTICMCVVSVG